MVLPDSFFQDKKALVIFPQEFCPGDHHGKVRRKFGEGLSPCHRDDVVLDIFQSQFGGKSVDRIGVKVLYHVVPCPLALVGVIFE